MDLWPVEIERTRCQLASTVGPQIGGISVPLPGFSFLFELVMSHG